MRDLHQLRSMFLLLFVAMLGSTWGAQHAYADTVSEFTGTWYTGLSGTNQDESSSGPVFFYNFGADGSHVAYFLSYPVTDGTLRPECSFYDSCLGPVSWSGTFVGGFMNMYIDTDAFGPTFTATITGGSYSGLNNGLVYPNEDLYDIETFTFTGQWPNGWTSVGTFTGGSSDFQGSFGGSGTLTMTTTAPSAVPEPSGMTLLGTGMVLVMASLRLRLRNGSPVS
jgi:hypothetical protein